MRTDKLEFNIISIRYLIIIILCFNSPISFSQVFNTDQYPPSVRWRQIRTEHFQLIYPTPFEDRAQQLAGQLERLREHVSGTLGKPPRRISIILQNQTVESNGNVQLAPRRSEFYTTPPQQGDFQDWLSNLAIHELRHVAQFDKLTGYLRAPFFEQLALAIYGVTLPSWFFEGDAVVTETVLSPAGRGRLPSWEMPFRANLLSGHRYSYQKDYLGSLKSVTPGFYELGYFMTAHMQREHGVEVIDSLMTRMAKLPIRPYNFSNSLKKFTGYNTRQWHRKTREELTGIWQEQLAETAPVDYPTWPAKAPGKPESWLLPKPLPDGRILALHQGVYRVPTLVILDSLGREQEVVKTGRQTEPNFSYAAGKVVWDEVRRHGRYGKRTYNVINIYDLHTRTHRQLTRRSRYFSPALSLDGKQVAAVEIDEGNAVSLVLLDAGTGNVISRFPSPANILLQTPAFDATGTKIVATGIAQQGSTIVEANVSTGTFRFLLDWQQQQIERPGYAIGRIVFKAHYNGIDNIFAVGQASGEIQQLTDARFGAFNPSYDAASGQLWFNNYQVDGYRVSHINQPIMQADNRPEITDSHISYFKPLLSHDKLFWLPDTTLSEKLHSKPYKGVKNLINFHSLSVDNGNFNSLNDINPGVYWLSDDLLNTTQLRLGYTYDGDIRSSAYLASISYQRFFPKFSLEYHNRGQVSTGRIIRNQGDTLVGLRWREHATSFKLEIPLAWYRLNHVISTGFSAATSYTRRYNLNEPQFQSGFAEHIRFPLHYQVYIHHQVRQSTLDLAPRWGQHLSVTYRHIPMDNRLSGEHLSVRTAFYFPGLWRNHSLVARFSYQRRDGVYGVANDIPMVSGYDQLRHVPVDNTLLFSYRFPIAYPDWSIGPLAYVKRFKGGFFADFQNVRAGNNFQPRTFGAELRSDMNLLRFYLPNFDFGVKLIYANETNAPQRMFATYSIGYSY